MTAIIRFVPLEEVEAGASLAEAIVDARGATLLPKGALLSETMLVALRRRGIDTVPLIEAAAPVDTRAEREKTLVRMRHLFRRSDATPANETFMQLATAYRLEKWK